MRPNILAVFAGTPEVAAVAPPHVVMRVRLNSGEPWILDLTGQQFGLPYAFLPQEEYKRRYVPRGRWEKEKWVIQTIPEGSIGLNQHLLTAKGDDNESLERELRYGTLLAPERMMVAFRGCILDVVEGWLDSLPGGDIGNCDLDGLDNDVQHCLGHRSQVLLDIERTCLS